MEKQQTITSRTVTLLLMAAVLLFVLISMLYSRHQQEVVSQSYKISTIQGDAKDIVNVSLDHKTYDTVRSLRDDADVVIVGSVLDSGATKESSSPGLSGDGTPAPGLIKTDFLVHTDRILKGDVDEEVIVVLTGGITDDVKYITEGVPWLSEGDSVIMYLVGGGANKYYPLAGGSALAIRQENGKYILPSSVSGSRLMEVSEPNF